MARRGTPIFSNRPQSSSELSGFGQDQKKSENITTPPTDLSEEQQKTSPESADVGELKAAETVPATNKFPDNNPHRDPDYRATRSSSKPKWNKWISDNFDQIASRPALERALDQEVREAFRREQMRRISNSPAPVLTSDEKKRHQKLGVAKLTKNNAEPVPAPVLTEEERERLKRLGLDNISLNSREASTPELPQDLPLNSIESPVQTAQDNGVVLGAPEINQDPSANEPGVEVKPAINPELQQVAAPQEVQTPEENLFIDASSFEELYAKLLKEGLEGSLGKYNPENLASIIQAVRDGKFKLSHVPKVKGLRNSVERLLVQDPLSRPEPEPVADTPIIPAASERSEPKEGPLPEQVVQDPIAHETAGSKPQEAAPQETEPQPNAILTVPKEGEVIEPEQMLDKARKEYFAAQKAVADSERGMNLSRLKSKVSKQELLEDLAKKEAFYMEMRADVVGENVAAALDEQIKAANARLEEYSKRVKPAEFVNEKLQFYHKLPKSVKIAVVAGMLGLGVVTGGTTAAVSLGFRQALSAASSFESTRQMMNAYRGKKLAERARVAKPDELARELVAYEMFLARKGLNLSDVKQDSQYKEMLERYNNIQLHAIEQKGMQGQQVDQAKELAAMLDQTNQAAKNKYLDERRFRAITNVLSGTLAAAIASGLPGKMVLKGLGYAPDALQSGQGAAKTAYKASAKALQELKQQVVDQANIPSADQLEHITGRGSDFANELSQKNITVEAPTSPISESLGNAQAPEVVSASKPPIPQVPEALSAAQAENIASGGAEVPRGTMVGPEDPLRNLTKTVEASADVVKPSVGARGIEGALLDLKKSDPNRFSRMLSWMQTNYPGYQGKDSSLIHKFVLDQQAKGKDINWVRGADVSVDSNGAVKFGKIEYTNAPAAPTPAEVPKFVPKTLDEELGISGVKGPKIEDDPRIGQVFEDKLNKGLSKGDAFQPVEFNQDADITSMPQSVEAARSLAAQSVEKTSDGLQLVLSDKYKSFLDTKLNVQAKALNSIKHLSYKDFLNSMAVSDRFKETYGGLAKFLKQSDLKPNAKIHSTVIELAEKWKQGQDVSGLRLAS